MDFGDILFGVVMNAVGLNSIVHCTCHYKIGQFASKHIWYLSMSSKQIYAALTFLQCHFNMINKSSGYLVVAHSISEYGFIFLVRTKL